MINESVPIKLPEELFSRIKEAQDRLQEAFKPIRENFKILAEKLPLSLKKLANHGWYISGDSFMSEGLTLSDELDFGNFEKVNKNLEQFYEKESSSIIDRLKYQYPGRSKMFDEAFKAHQRKMYFASTNLFLSLADGLCNGSLFKTKNNKANLKKELTGTHYLDVFLAVITQESAIDIAYSKKSKFPSSLNRHGVLHGLDFEYGTKINSLKALSLLAFIGDFFNKSV